ncbi:two pore domain potassium channel family protein [Spiractinospora alimapuensis]|uniref:potassium channel family protein n=1 Tax=Spiractinospora alimapuensis TaxID=2820884 RepID=UPI001F2AE3F8|nr:potassium channel family protein [Spiractinospora alimapuensis]QVQ50003.1 two pore domain potassium channel family protein [Spiractinospora alimapuensis]
MRALEAGPPCDTAHLTWGTVVGGDVRGWGSTAAGVVGVLVLYYVLPLDTGMPKWAIWARAVGFVLGIGFVVLVVARAARRQEWTTAGNLPFQGLTVVTVFGVVLFALADYVMARARPEQFVDLHTRTDALYFTVTTLATVGYGDVHAEGQLARILVTVQILFNLIVLATAAWLVTQRLRSRQHRA